MSDEDDVDDVDVEQDEVESDKEIEEWEDYRKEIEEVFEEVRVCFRRVFGVWDQRGVGEGCLYFSFFIVVVYFYYGGYDEGRVFIIL